MVYSTLTIEIVVASQGVVEPEARWVLQEEVSFSACSD